MIPLPVPAREPQPVTYETAFAGAEGEYHSHTLPGFWLRVEWLWQEPLPHPLRALGEIVGLAPEVVEQFLQALGGGAERG